MENERILYHRVRSSKKQQKQQKQDKAKKSCMVSFRQLHSHLKLLSNNNLNGTRTESGFKRAFATLFGQDVETFIDTMFLNMDQLEKQLDKEEFTRLDPWLLLKYSMTHVSDVHQVTDISRPILDEELMAEVTITTAKNQYLSYWTTAN
ncbi:hypothetical protein Tco_1215872 [Tanacetum coccineum]